MSDRWERVKELFKEALELSPEERQPFLAVSCAGEEGLRDEVEGLLSAHAKAKDFIESPAPFPSTQVESRCLDSAESAAVSDKPTAALKLAAADENRYAFGGEHARGGLGRILKARDLRLKRPVAVKELLRGGREAEARFVREALITARLEHPSIVPVHDLARNSDGTPFYSMKMVAGRSLSEVIEEKKTLEERMSLLPHVIALADAVAYAHGQRVIHRDLKPSNVLIGPFGETLVIDWGLAADLREPKDSSQTEMSIEEDVGPGLTATGAILGTAQYMPPEQAAGKPVNERADVYALGAILYRVLAGVAPYTGDSTPEVLAKVSGEVPVPLEQREPGVPLDLAAIVRKAMARDASERYPTARELTEDLKRFQLGQLVGAYHYSRPALVLRWFQRHRAPATVGMIFALVTGVAAQSAVSRILHERNRAQHALALAEARNDELTIEHLRNVLERDPTAVLAALKSYPRVLQRWEVIQEIATDAISRGVARHQLKHNGVIQDAAFSSDGKLLATGSRDKAVRLWDPRTGKLIRSTQHEADVNQVLFSPDNRLVASSSNDQTVHLWDLTTEEVGVLRGHTAPVHGIEFSTDGRQLASAALDGSVRLWNVKRREGKVAIQFDDEARLTAFSPEGRLLASASHDELKVFDLPTRRTSSFRAPSQILSFAFSHGGRTLAFSTIGGLIGLFDLSSHRSQYLRGHQGAVSSVRFSQDDHSLYSGGIDKTVRRWDLNSLVGQVIGTHDGAVHAIAVSRDGKRLASSSVDRTARLWVSGADGQILMGHTEAIDVLSFSPDGGALVTGADDGTVRIWDLAENNPVTLVGHTGSVFHAIFAPDHRTVATDGRDRTVRVWSTEGSLLKIFRGHRKLVFGIAFSPDGHQLASSSADSSIRLVNLRTSESQTLAGHRASVMGVSYSASGESLLSVSDDGTVRLWDIQSGSSQVILQHDGAACFAAFSRSGNAIVSRGLDNRVRTFSMQMKSPGPVFVAEGKFCNVGVSSADDSVAIPSGKDVLVIDLSSGSKYALAGSDGKVRVAAFSPRGDHLVSGDDLGQIRVWHLREGTSKVFAGHQKTVRDVAFAPDGQYFATSSDDRVIRIWNLQAGLVRTLRGHTGWVYRIQIASDGRHLLSASGDGTAKIWPLDHGPVSWLPEDPSRLPGWLASVTSLESK